MNENITTSSQENINQNSPWQQFDQNDTENTGQENTQPRESMQGRGAKFLAMQNLYQDPEIKDTATSQYRRNVGTGTLESKRPNAQRMEAYVRKIDRIHECSGERGMERIMRLSAKRVITPAQEIADNEAFWKQQEQINHDRYGDKATISEPEKLRTIRNIQAEQEMSLRPWARMLADDDVDYPTWFKIYAFEGISKMSDVYDVKKKLYEKRTKGTVAPFPKLNKKALDGVYELLDDFYGISDGEPEQADLNSQMLKLARSGNFRKLYSRMVEASKTTLPVPEKFEDVNGEWEFVDDPLRVAGLAECTPWCVKNSNVAANYIENGSCYDSDDDNTWNDGSKGGFWLFRLKNTETGQLSDNACASVRMNPDGNVAEISGILDKSQALNNSLVPVVADFVKDLPGGEEYMDAVNDVRYLVDLGRKIDQKQPFSEQDLRFIFEVDRGIKSLNYGKDPRIEEYQDIKMLLDNGTDAQILLQYAAPLDVVRNLDAFRGHNANVDITAVVSQLDSFEVAENLDILMRNGADINIDSLVNDLSEFGLAENLEVLLKYGAQIDVQQLADDLSPDERCKYIELLEKSGAKVDVDKLLEDASSLAIVENLESLLSHDAEIDIHKLLDELPDEYLEDIMGDSVHPIIEYFGTLNKYVDQSELLGRLNPADIALNLDSLIDQGARMDVDSLAQVILSNFDTPVVLECLPSLREHGAYINIDEWVVGLDEGSLRHFLPELLKNEADVEKIVPMLSERDVLDNLGLLIKHGAKIDVNELAEKISPREELSHLDVLMKYGAEINVNDLVDEMNIYWGKDDAKMLLRYGADAELVKQKIETDLRSESDSYLALTNINNINFYLDSGVDADLIGSKMPVYVLPDAFKTLGMHGANVTKLAKQMDLTDLSYNDIEKLVGENGLTADDFANILVEQYRDPYILLFWCEPLREWGANIDFNEAARQSNVDFRNSDAISQALYAGVDPKILIEKGVDPEDISKLQQKWW